MKMIFKKGDVLSVQRTNVFGKGIIQRVKLFGRVFLVEEKLKGWHATVLSPQNLKGRTTTLTDNELDVGTFMQVTS